MTENRLDRETSPYLLQHRANPVHWQPWDAEALDLARTGGRPILLSVGYAACHWCHVMAHESFEDPETAALMNKLYVNIKVDREQRPDIDAIYQTALALLGQQGGWPLTMFLTPTGEPFWGGTYFPPRPAFGRPSFLQVLRRLHEVHEAEPETVVKNTTALVGALRNIAGASQAGNMSDQLLGQTAAKAMDQFDPVHGGLAGAPKFPQCSLLQLLWRATARGGDARYRDAVLLALRRMSQGGIYDHLGGGYARYSVDQRWLVPHFEKMLYDNAQLIDLLCLAWQHSREPLFADRVAETVGWTLRDMIAEGGAFAAAVDADSDGAEGLYYVWDKVEVDRLLGPDAALFCRHYEVTEGGNWEGRTILNRLDDGADLSTDDRQKLAAARALLLRQREKRPPPGRDDKVLADWNGLMIAALVNAGMVFDQPAWVAAAGRAFDFITTALAADDAGGEPRLHHTTRAGRAQHAALLDDYTAMARAALALFECNGETHYLDHAVAWLEVVESHFHDPAQGGYFHTPDDGESLIARMKPAADQAMPSGNGLAAGVLARLYHLTGEPLYRARAEAVITAFAGATAGNIGHSELLNAYETLVHGHQIVIVGAGAGSRALRRAILDVALPDRILNILAPDQPLAPGHPAHGKQQLGGQATAYVCIGNSCSLPIVDPSHLREMLLSPDV